MDCDNFPTLSGRLASLPIPSDTEHELVKDSGFSLTSLKTSNNGIFPGYFIFIITIR